MAHPAATKPLWISHGELPKRPSLDNDLTVDAAVIGGGITGATAAYLLKEAGMSVALLERDRCGGGDTFHTSAHLTAVTDTTFPELVSALGDRHATAVWDSGYAALDQISRIAGDADGDCHFQWIPGYLSARFPSGHNDDLETLREIARLSSEAGFDATFTDAIPHLGLPGVRFEHQARFRPLPYLKHLLDTIDGGGSHVFERSAVSSIEGSPAKITVGSHTVHARFVVIATHIPIMGKTGLVKATLLQTDLYPYSSYVIAARVPKGVLPDALIWDLSDPYHFVRLDGNDGDDIVVFGGHDHKTGQLGDTTQPYHLLEEMLRGWIPEAVVTHRWSGQVVETRDGLPYIGETSEGQFVVTGFGGNGITFGTVGAIMARDAALGRTNPWSGLFDAGRTRIAQGLWDYLSENKDYPYYLIRDRFAGPEGKDLRSVGRGEGKLIDMRGNRVAAYRDDRGTLTVLSPVCTHMGCHVAWNPAESTWDCPCHGSRFTPTGKVFAGPAETSLKSYFEKS